MIEKTKKHLLNLIRPSSIHITFGSKNRETTIQSHLHRPHHKVGVNRPTYMMEKMIWIISILITFINVSIFHNTKLVRCIVCRDRTTSTYYSYYHISVNCPSTPSICWKWNTKIKLMCISINLSLNKYLLFLFIISIY